MSFKKISILVISLVFLSSCYLPSSFDAEMELSRQGLYKITFDGYIVDLNIFRNLRDKKYKEGSEEAKIKVKAVIDDFKRDKATKSVSYFVNRRIKLEVSQRPPPISWISR
jgi:hypothetical protein